MPPSRHVTASFTWLVLLSGLLLAEGCATLPARDRAYDPALCNRGAAYEAGFNDGQDGRAMGSAFLDSCREDLRKEGQEGYRSGYDTGHARFDERMKAMNNPATTNSAAQPPVPPRAAGAPTPVTPGVTAPANVNNGVQINIGGIPVEAAEPPASKASRAWYCKVHVFNNDFDSFGPTQLEARQMTIQNCMQQYHPMHCREVKCQPNR